MVRRYRDQKGRIRDAMGKAFKLGRSGRAEEKNVGKMHATARAAGKDPETGKAGARAVGHAMWQKLTGRSPKAEESMTLKERAEKLVAKYGTATAAGKASGMSRHAIGRALKGKNLNAKNTEKLEAQERRDALKPRVTQRIKKSMTGIPQSSQSDSPQNTFGIYALVEVSSDKPEERWLYPGRMTGNAGALDDLEDLAAEGPEALQERIQEIMDEYVECEVLEIMDIQW
ncbi:hypothetical protein ABZ644_25045 [Nocardiopsis alba]|uniref:hypothetical protein n=1 Tax=Nocardiopsis alba TaxID=53437 RepID=UPI0033E62310